MVSEPVDTYDKFWPRRQKDQWVTETYLKKEVPGRKTSLNTEGPGILWGYIRYFQRKEAAKALRQWDIHHLLEKQAIFNCCKFHQSINGNFITPKKLGMEGLFRQKQPWCWFQGGELLFVSAAFS